MTLSRAPVILLLAVLGIVLGVIVCATVLASNGTPVPSWFEVIAASGFGGVLGAYQPAASLSPPSAPPAGTPVTVAAGSGGTGGGGGGLTSIKPGP